MSANVESMFSALKTPWHGLGTVTDGVLTSQDALVTAGLDWQVKLENVYFLNQEMREQNVDGKYAVVRDTDESCYGIVGSRYTPVQNMDAFNFMDALVDSGDAKYETAGSLNGGQTIFILMKLSKVLEINDDVQPYMLLTNTHDGSGALKVLMTPVRVVCSNTLRMALSGTKTNVVSIRHTSSIQGKISEARNILGIADMFYDSFSQDVNRLIDTEINNDIFTSIIDKMFPLPVIEEDNPTTLRQFNNTNTIRTSIKVNYSVETAQGNANGWGLLNAYNSFELWQRKMRGAKTADARLEKQAGSLIHQDSALSNAVVKELIKL